MVTASVTIRRSAATLRTLCIVAFLTTASLFLAIPDLGPLIFDRSAQAVLPYFTSLPARHWLYAAALTAPQVCAAAAGPFWGHLSDRYGPKRSLIVALSGGAVCMGVVAYAIAAREAVLLVSALALLGVMDGSEVITQAVILEESAAPDKPIHIGILTACSTLGLVGGPLLGGGLASIKVFALPAYCTPFIFTALLFVVATAVVVFGYTETARDRSAPRRVNPLWVDLKRLVDPTRVRNTIGLFFLMEIALACYYEQLPLLLQHDGASPDAVGLFAAYIAVLIGVTCVFIVPFLKRQLTDDALIAGGFILLVVAGTLLLNGPNSARIWASGAPLGIGAAAIYCLAMARLSDATGSSDQGKISGIASAVAGAAFLVAGVMVGWSGDAGAHATVAIMIAGALGLYLLRRRVERLEAHPTADP